MKQKLQKLFQKVLSSSRNFFIFCLSISLVVHLAISYKSVLKTIKQSLRVSKPEQKLEQRIRLQLKTADIPHPTDKRMQVVNDDQVGIKEKSIDAKYLGEKDNKVLRETKAAILDIHKKAGLGERDGVKEKNEVQKEVGAKQVGSSKQFKKEQSKGSGSVSLNDLSLENLGEAAKKITSKSITQGIKSGSKGEVGFAQNNDYLENVKLGDLTSLNTVEFKFYGYYHRIRQKLEQYWGNSLREKAESLYRQGRTIAADSDKMTFLVITLNDLGEITKIHIKSTSGIKELDDAAIESFNKAGPFPNPPKGMVENGSAQIEWGFVVKG